MNGDISFLEFGSIEADTGKSQIFFGKVCGWHFHPMPQGGGWFQGPRIRVGLHGNDPGPAIYVFLRSATWKKRLQSFELPVEKPIHRRRRSRDSADSPTAATRREFDLDCIRNQS